MRHSFLKALILSAFLIGIVFHANAQGTNVTLVVTKTNGQEQIFQLTDKSQLYFENGENLVIDDGAGTTTTFELSHIRKITSTEITGVADNTLPKLQPFPNPSRNSFVIKDLQGTFPASVFSLDGRLVKSFTASEGIPVDISELSSGMYLLHIDGQTLKLMKL